MNLARLLVFTVVLTIGLAGCSDSRELSTSAQARGFVVTIARGGDPGKWHIAAGADAQATRAWTERETLKDLGVRLRREGKAWACEFAESAIALSNFGTFSEGDRTGIAGTAKALGATDSEIDPLLNDVLKLSVPDLSKATASVCA
jgi:hypothetical protein